MIENITTAAPSTIDVEIRRINDELGSVGYRIAHISASLDRDSHDPFLGVIRSSLESELRSLVDRQATLFTERSPFNQEFLRRDGWNRFWIVTNGNGHVHKTKSCPTCRPTTQFYWLAELSGMSYEDLVKQAGERACTVCFPDAPTEDRERPTAIFTPTELERQQRAQEREAKRVEAVKKLIFTPDGQPLRDDLGLVIKTEVTAQRHYVEAAADAYVWDPARGDEGPYGGRPEHVTAENWKLIQQRNADDHAGHAARFLEALAAKRGTTVDEQRATLEPKVRAYIKRNYPDSI